MRADLKGAFATFAKDVNYDEMADAVYSGDYRRVFQTLPMDTLRDTLQKGLNSAGRALLEANAIEADDLERKLPTALTATAPELARQLPQPRPAGGGRGKPPSGDTGFATMDLPPGGKGPDTRLLPTIDNDRVLGYVGTRTGELIQNVTADLQTNVQNAVAVGMTNNLSPRQVAGLIRDNLPLNVRQQGALDKYKAGLAETNLSKKRQRELSERYREALVDERATTIARTETQYAINQGMAASWQEAQRQGLIGYNSMKRWQCEAEPCAKICEPMSGRRVRINDLFELPNSTTVYTAPAHVRCRCSVVLEPDT